MEDSAVLGPLNNSLGAQQKFNGLSNPEDSNRQAK